MLGSAWRAGRDDHGFRGNEVVIAWLNGSSVLAFMCKEVGVQTGNLSTCCFEEAGFMGVRTQLCAIGNYGHVSLCPQSHKHE